MPFGSVYWIRWDIRQLLCRLRTCSICTLSRSWTELLYRLGAYRFASIRSIPLSNCKSMNLRFSPTWQEMTAKSTTNVSKITKLSAIVTGNRSRFVDIEWVNECAVNVTCLTDMCHHVFTSLLAYLICIGNFSLVEILVRHAVCRLPIPYTVKISVYPRVFWGEFSVFQRNRFRIRLHP